MNSEQIEDLKDAATDLAISDPNAAVVILRFLELVNADSKTQSAASLTWLLGQAMVESEDAVQHEPDPDAGE